MKQISRLASGKVAVHSPAQVTTDRYQMLDLASTEPNLGTSVTGAVLTSNTFGTRIWTKTLALNDLTVTGNISGGRIYTDNLFFANGAPFISATAGVSNIYNGKFVVGLTQVAIDSVSVTGISTVRWTITARDTINNKYKSSTVDSVNDGVTTYYNEYGVILSNAQAEVAVFSTSIDNDIITLYAIGDSSTVNVTFQRVTLGDATIAGTIPGVNIETGGSNAGTSSTTCVPDVFTGNGVATTFTLTQAPVNENQTIVAVGGLLQPKSVYSVSGTTLTLSSPPGVGVPVDVTTFITEPFTGYVGSGGSNVISNWTKVTVDYTAVNGDKLIANTSNGSFIITLPATPGLGHSVRITDGYGFGINGLTVAANGSFIENQPLDVFVDISNIDLELIFDGETWQVISTTGPRGPMGYTGSAGTGGSGSGDGYTGSAGTIGYTGSVGTGYTGSVGTAGATGPIGATGPAGGPTGATGPVGATGATGGLGYTGSVGYTGSIGLLDWTTVSTSRTLINRERLMINSSAGSFTLTLPATPATGTYIQLTDGGNLATNPVTIARNGSTIENDPNNLILDVPNATIEFIYDGATWQVTSTAGPRGQIGYTGSIGPAGGPTGPTGLTGYTGSIGTNGSIGYTGSVGAAGFGTLAFNTRTYTGDGTNTAFTVSSGLTADSVIVLENGILQSPATDYTVTGTSLTFATAPDNAVVVQIRELLSTSGTGYTGSIGASGALGYTGSIGPAGATGPIGYGGSTGSSGAIGYTGSIGIVTYTEVTSNITLTANSKYFVDTSAARTLTLPTTPTMGQEISIIDGTGNAATNNITIARNGNKIQGLAEDMTVSTNRAAFVLAYYNAANGWLLTQV